MSSPESKNAVFLYSAQIEQYHYPPDCPFKTERAGMTRGILKSMGLLLGDGVSEVSPVAADAAALEKFHTRRYLEVIRAAEAGTLDVEGLNMGLGSEDCPVFVGMYDYAALACGATLTGAELIWSGQAHAVFNPSGGYHHAGPSNASGFCYINDVVLACIALVAHSLRVLYIDIDVHHGDGVQNAFYDSPDVMTISLHEDGRTLFPGTGSVDETGVGPGSGFSVNVPLPAGTYDEAYLNAFDSLAVPLGRAYNPDVVVLELGMDALAGDPMAHLNLTNNAHAAVVEAVMTLNKPVLAVGGGGYHPRNTARGWALAWSILSEYDTFGGADSFGLGGVMLESTDWHGGLRDRVLAVDSRQRDEVDGAVRGVIEAVKANIFGVHGL